MAWCVCVCVCLQHQRMSDGIALKIFIFFSSVASIFFISFLCFCQPSLLMEICSLRLWESIRGNDEWERERGNKCVLLIIIHQLFSSNFLYFFGGWIWRICMNDKNYYSNDGNRFWCLIHERIYTWFLLLVVVWCEKQIIFAQQIWKAICS